MNITLPTAVASPCNRICQLDGDEICVGCFRTKSEIACWSRLNDRDRAAVNAAAKERDRQRHRIEPNPN